MSPTHRHPTGQTGTSLIEVIVAMALIATVFLGIVAGMLTTVRASGSTRAGASAASSLAAAGERIRTMTYRPCVTSSGVAADYAASSASAGAPPATQVEILAVRHWDPATGSFATSGTACTVDGGVQMVRLRVSSGTVSSIGEVVRRDPGARPR